MLLPAMDACIDFLEKQWLATVVNIRRIKLQDPFSECFACINTYGRKSEHEWRMVLEKYRQPRKLDQLDLAKIWIAIHCSKSGKKESVGRRNGSFQNFDDQCFLS